MIIITACTETKEEYDAVGTCLVSHSQHFANPLTVNFGRE